MKLPVDELPSAKRQAQPEDAIESGRRSSLDLPGYVLPRTLTVCILLLTAAILAAGLWSLSRQLAPHITPPESQQSTYVASFPEKSIAVLPFKSVGQAMQETLPAEVLQDAIITSLSRVSELRVISSTSVSGYTADQPRDLRRIAQSLGAGHLLEGAVSRSGKNLKLSLELTDARWGRKLWSVEYKQEAGNLFTMQGDIVRRVGAQLHARVLPEENASIEQTPTRDLVAYGLYVRAKALVASVTSAQINEKLTQAVELLDQAVARDPKFYLAWCQLSAAHDYIYFFGFDHTPTELALAESALQTLTRLRPNAGETHLARATYLYRCHLNYDAARAELALTQRALPNNSEAFELIGYIDRRQGLWSESRRSLQRALELDPRNSFLLQEIGVSYQEFRQFRAMAAALDRALAITPRNLDARIARALVELEWRADTRPLRETLKALLTENPDSASALADQWLYLSLCERDSVGANRALAALPASGTAIDINFPRSWCEALVARAAGDEERARQALLAAHEEVEKTVRDQPDYGPSHTVLGLIDAGLGRKEEAIREGRRAVELLPISRDALDGGELMKYLAMIYAWCGERDLALDQITATLKISSSASYGNFRLHPAWDSLRGDPRFEKIVASLAPKESDQ
jgi:TolB-like protein/Tfp pilus assembly protein PilF